MLQIADRVKETTTTTGTGALTLAGAITGFRAFSTVCADQDTAWYALQAVDTNGVPTGDWEVGVGTYNTSGNTLTRTTIFASSNSNAAVSLAAGTKQVWIGQPAGRVALPSDGEPDTPPVLADFGWVNQGATVAVQRDGYISVVSTTTPGMAVLMQAAPGTPYAAVARMKGLQTLNYQGFGLCFYDSGAGGLITLGVLGADVRVSSWTNVNTYKSDIFIGSTIAQPPWLRLRNDGTDLYADMSVDGYSWQNVYANANAADLGVVPDSVGFYLNNSNGAAAACSLNSFKVG